MKLRWPRSRRPCWSSALWKGALLGVGALLTGCVPPKPHLGHPKILREPAASLALRELQALSYCTERLGITAGLRIRRDTQRPRKITEALANLVPDRDVPTVLTCLMNREVDLFMLRKRALNRVPVRTRYRRVPCRYTPRPLIRDPERNARFTLLYPPDCPEGDPVRALEDAVAKACIEIGYHRHRFVRFEPLTTSSLARTGRHQFH